MPRTNLFALAACLCCARAAAQSVNIDFGDPATAPPASYGGAGVPGVWNVIESAPLPVPLVGLLGQPTAIMLQGDIGSTFGSDDPATSGDHEALFDDGLGGMGDVVGILRLGGLINGQYRVTVYGWTPNQPSNLTMVFINGNPGQAPLIGGPWPGQPKSPITHIALEVTIADGAIDIEFVGGVWGNSAFINGLQLQRLHPADLNADGMVNIDDLLALLAMWGPCPAGGGCTGDLNGDAVVNIDDLLALISAWG